MDEIVRSMTEHPLVAIAVGLSALLLVYFLFKSLLKLVLILILVAVVIVGYNYLKDPSAGPVDIRDAVEKARIEAVRVVDQGKDVYDKGKEWVDIGKGVFDKGVDKGREVVEKGKEGVGQLGGKISGAERDAGGRPKP